MFESSWGGGRQRGTGRGSGVLPRRREAVFMALRLDGRAGTLNAALVFQQEGKTTEPSTLQRSATFSCPPGGSRGPVDHEIAFVEMAASGIVSDDDRGAFGRLCL